MSKSFSGKYTLALGHDSWLQVNWNWTSPHKLNTTFSNLFSLITSILFTVVKDSHFFPNVHRTVCQRLKFPLFRVNKEQVRQTLHTSQSIIQSITYICVQDLEHHSFRHLRKTGTYTMHLNLPHIHNNLSSHQHFMFSVAYNGSNSDSRSIFHHPTWPLQLHPTPPPKYWLHTQWPHTNKFRASFPVHITLTMLHMY